mgnify:CR=1
MFAVLFVCENLLLAGQWVVVNAAASRRPLRVWAKLFALSGYAQNLINIFLKFFWSFSFKKRTESFRPAFYKKLPAAHKT